MQDLDLELRKQVAIATGKNVFKGDYKDQLIDYWADCSMSIPIPEYELSIDAIAAEFDKKGWGWSLESVHYQSSDSIEYLATSGFYELKIEAKTAAIALCKLFLEIHQQEQGLNK